MAVVADLPQRPSGFDKFFFKFGRVAALGAGTERIICDGAAAAAYTGLLATEQPLTVVSTSDLDKVGGGGATDILFFYQGEDGIEHAKTVTLNGLTPVSTGISAQVSYRAFVIESEGYATLPDGNAGDIICYQTDTPTNILWRISANQGQTLMCLYRVPSNKVLKITGIHVFPQAGKPVVVRLRAKSSITKPWRVQTVIDAQDAPVTLQDINNPQLARPGAIIALTAVPAQAGTNISATISGMLEDYNADDYPGLVAY